MRRLFLLPALLAAPMLPAEPIRQQPPAVTTERARSAPVFTFYLENDFFGGQDRHYTNGLKFSWLSSDLSAWNRDGWRRRLVDRLPLIESADAQQNFGFALGQNIYTPQDISRNPPDPADRPYAGWTYLELSFVSKTPGVMDMFTVQAGMIGPGSQADETQRAVHSWLSDEEPAGWAHQLRNEFGMNLVFERKWRLYARSFQGFVGADFVPHAGVSLGNVQTHANAGFTLRLGFNLPSDFGVRLIGGTNANTPLDDRDPRVAPDRAWSFFAFGGVDGRAVARDIFLDGNSFRDSPRVKREPLVGDAYYGLGLVFGPWELTYTEVMRSREFKGQVRNNYFGSVALSRAF